MPPLFFMFSLLGAPALSQFRLEKLLSAVQAADLPRRAIRARWIHFVDAPEALSPPELALLGKLLTYGPPPPTRRAAAGSSSRREPARSRPGRARPPISRMCAAWAVFGAWSEAPCTTSRRQGPLDAADMSRAAAHLHDRMTESFWIDVEPTECFMWRRPGRCAWLA
jgi:phosphoribosylformylglycinamidine synthase